MRKITMLTLVTVALLTGGCNRGWPRWLCRGDECGSSCADGSDGNQMSPTYGPSYGGGTYMPSYSSPTPELPGPITVAPNG